MAKDIAGLKTAGWFFIFMGLGMKALAQGKARNALNRIA